MILIKKESQNDRMLFEVKGHANYAKYGEDIVCASVSTACLMTANLIECLGLSYNITKLICEEGYFVLEFKLDKTLEAVGKNLSYTFDELIKEYPKFIKYNR